MKFSEYIVIENPGGSVDPLGFLRPSGALGDNLFKQFTVLSVHPAYHGFLACAFGRLAEEGTRPGSAAFSTRFRDLEIPWGIANGRAKTSILNVTKYADFVGMDDFRLSKARRAAKLYAKRAYGTLGHYSSPSAAWGILEPDGTRLTDLGKRLGKAWACREGHDFDSVLRAWSQDQPVGALPDFAAAVEHHPLDAPPSDDERQTWQQLIEGYCKRYPAIAALWSDPLPAGVQAFAASEATYGAYFPGIAEHYADDAVIRDRVDLAQRFELLAAASQFIFEWEYVRRLDEARQVGLDAAELAVALAALVVQRAQAYTRLPGFRDAGKLFQRLATCAGYDEVAATVLDHHAQHQRGKGAAAFIAGGEVVIMDRVDPSKFTKLFMAIKEDLGSLERRLHWNYRRGWNFDRALRWLDYAGGVQ